MAISSTFEKLWERFEREQRIYDSVMEDDSSPIVEKRTLEIYYSIQTNLNAIIDEACRLNDINEEEQIIEIVEKLLNEVNNRIVIVEATSSR